MVPAGPTSQIGDPRAKSQVTSESQALPTTRVLTALLLSDGKPGHYHQAEGVIAAISRLRPVDTVRLQVRRRWVVPTRTLHQLINAGVRPEIVLWLGYGLRPKALPSADLVVSAGGETLAANAATARLLGAGNVFCGRLRRLAPEHVRVVIVALARFADLPNHLVSMPPSPLDASSKRRADAAVRFGSGNPPRVIGALIGGNSGTLRYTDGDWMRLTAFMRDLHRRHGVHWFATTSRRSGRFIGDALSAMAGEADSPLIRFIDYRTAGPGALAEIFAAADAVVCTEDSTTMISEAVGAQLPVVTVSPDTSRLEKRELEYRAFLAHQGWYRSLPLATLSSEAYLRALGEVTPRTTSQLDELADALRQRIPELFPDA